MAEKDKVDEVFREFNDTVNMSPSELEAWEKSENREAYAERKSGGEPINKPLEDIMQLKDTPKSQWADKDDRFNEVEEAEQALRFIARMSGNEDGEDIPGTDPGISKRVSELVDVFRCAGVNEALS